MRGATIWPLVVVGAGPAAAALAGAAMRRGIGTLVVAPDPLAPWVATYGAWTDELPTDLPPQLHAGSMPDARAIGPDGTVQQLHRNYVVLSTAGLQAHLWTAEPEMLDARAVGVWRRGCATGVALADGRVVQAGVVIDASGARRVLSGGPPQPPRAAQTAYGVVVPRNSQVEMAFMDWRADHGHGGWPTFLYSVPVDADRVLLEETSLARRPGLPLEELRRRLHDRLASRGVPVPADAVVERVAFPVDLPVSVGAGTVVPFGAAAPLMHPATGFSVAAALRWAPRVADSLARHLPQDPLGAAEAARAVLWSTRARLVHHLRRRGLEVLLSLPRDHVGAFFSLFFALPAGQQRAYLSSRDDVTGMASAMLSVFAAADAPMRRHLLRWGVPPVGDAAAARQEGWHDAGR